MEKALEARYLKAMKRIGGAAVLITLPNQIKEVLKNETRMEVKVKMLEAIADQLRK